MLTRQTQGIYFELSFLYGKALNEENDWDQDTTRGKIEGQKCRMEFQVPLRNSIQ